MGVGKRKANFIDLNDENLNHDVRNDNHSWISTLSCSKQVPRKKIQLEQVASSSRRPLRDVTSATNATTGIINGFAPLGFITETSSLFSATHALQPNAPPSRDNQASEFAIAHTLPAAHSHERSPPTDSPLAKHYHNTRTYPASRPRDSETPVDSHQAGKDDDIDDACILRQGSPAQHNDSVKLYNDTVILQSSHLSEPMSTYQSFRYTIKNGKNVVRTRFYRDKGDHLFHCIVTCGKTFHDKEGAIEHLENLEDGVKKLHFLQSKWPS